MSVDAPSGHATWTSADTRARVAPVAGERVHDPGAVVPGSTGAGRRVPGDGVDERARRHGPHARARCPHPDRRAHHRRRRPLPVARRRRRDGHHRLRLRRPGARRRAGPLRRRHPAGGQAARRTPRALLPPGDPAIGAVSTVGEQLPVYTGLVENARALNRLGLPLGQSYLASASKLMQGTILPAVEQVRTAESAELAAAYRRGAATPFAVLAVGARRLRRAGRPRAARAPPHQPGAQRRPAGGGPGRAGCGGVVGGRGVAADPRLGGAQGHSDAGAALDDARIAVLSGAQQREPRARGPQQRSAARPTRRSPCSSRASSPTAGCSPRPSARTRSSPTGSSPSARPPRRGATRTAASASSTTRASTRGRRVGRRPAGRAPRAARSTRSTRRLPRRSARSAAAFAVDVEAAEGALVALPWVSAALALVAAGAVAVGIGRRVGEYR